MRKFQPALLYALAVSLALSVLPLAQAKQEKSKPAEENFFQPCEEVISTPSFAKLKKFTDSRKEEEAPKPEQCFRLNESEFLVTIVDDGISRQGLYFYDAKSGKFELVNGTYFPNIEIDREFTSKGKKHFVLLRGLAMRQAILSKTYAVLYLKPGKGVSSFAMKTLSVEVVECEAVDAYEGTESGNSKKADEAMRSEITDIRITDAAENSPKIEFDFSEQTCDGANKKSFTKSFVFKKGDFVEVK